MRRAQRSSMLLCIHIFLSVCCQEALQNLRVALRETGSTCPTTNSTLAGCALMSHNILDLCVHNRLRAIQHNIVPPDRRPERRCLLLSDVLFAWPQSTRCDDDGNSHIMNMIALLACGNASHAVLFTALHDFLCVCVPECVTH